MRQLPVFFQHFIVKKLKHAAKVKESYCESIKIGIHRENWRLVDRRVGHLMSCQEPVLCSI